jgi:hypothetical protein
VTPSEDLRADGVVLTHRRGERSTPDFCNVTRNASDFAARVNGTPSLRLLGFPPSIATESSAATISSRVYLAWWSLVVGRRPSHSGATVLGSGEIQAPPDRTAEVVRRFGAHLSLISAE